MLFHHHVLLLVFLYEGVPDLASCYIHFGAHAVRIASTAGVFLLQAMVWGWKAPWGWFIFYQPFFYQTVPRRLIDVQGKRSDATLEEAALLSTRFGESGLLLENCILMIDVCKYRLFFLVVPIQKFLSTTTKTKYQNCPNLKKLSRYKKTKYRNCS